MNGVFVETQIGSFGMVWFGLEKRGEERRSASPGSSSRNNPSNYPVDLIHILFRLQCIAFVIFSSILYK